VNLFGASGQLDFIEHRLPTASSEANTSSAAVSAQADSGDPLRRVTSDNQTLPPTALLRIFVVVL
jgi:hypothetical protein